MNRRRFRPEALNLEARLPLDGSVETGTDPAVQIQKEILYSLTPPGATTPMDARMEPLTPPGPAAFLTDAQVNDLISTVGTRVYSIVIDGLASDAYGTFLGPIVVYPIKP